VPKVTDIASNEPERINSICTDTCATMELVGDLLKTKLPRILVVPFDFHGLQLLIKDLLGIRALEKVLQKANSLVAAFKRSHRKMALLREHQLDKLGFSVALANAVPTRWGTQIRLFKSLVKSRAAFEAYENDPRVKDDKILQLNLSLDRRFFQQIDDMVAILDIISEAQMASESSRSTIDTVLPRWKFIENHLRSISMSTQNEFVNDIRAYLDAPRNGWNQRFQRQVRPIHKVAAYLNPRTPSKDLKGTHPLKRYMMLMKRFSRSGDELEFRRQFIRYAGRVEVFRKLPDSIWDLKNDPIDFWLEAKQAGYAEIANMAIRLLTTPCNSVASERSFSDLNYIHNRVRNRLGPSKVDKLQFLYRNLRNIDPEAYIYGTPRGNGTRLMALEASMDDQIDDIELEDKLHNATDIAYAASMHLEEEKDTVLEEDTDSDEEIL